MLKIEKLFNKEEYIRSRYYVDNARFHDIPCSLVDQLDFSKIKVEYFSKFLE